MREWRRNNPEKRREAEAKYKLRYPEKIRAKSLRLNAKYRATEKCRLQRRIIDSRKRAAGTLKRDDIIAVFAFFEGKCAYCGGPGTDVEHAVAVKIGGRTERRNILLACHPCNASKGAREMYSWFKSKKFYTRKAESKIRRWLAQ